MRRVSSFLIALLILAGVNAACADFVSDDSPPDNPVNATSPATPVSPSTTPIRLPPPPTRNPQITNLAEVAVGLAVPENALVSVQYPAFVEAEIVGHEIESVAEVAGQIDVNGRHRLLALRQLQPDGSGLGRMSHWRAGVHELPLIWNTEADVLNDGANEEYALVVSHGENVELLAIRGSYQRAGEEGRANTLLLIDPEVRARNQLRDLDSGVTLEPRPGDAFLPDALFLGEDGQFVKEPGKRLVFDATAQIGLERQLLPAGGYFLGVSVRGPGGEIATETVDFIIEDRPLLPGYRAYLDPNYGFQFLYPADWPAPVGENGRLAIRQPSGTLELNITFFQNTGGRGADELKREVIQAFGSIQILFEDLIEVGGSGALWTAYGYHSAVGPRTGVFVVLVDGERGYIIDADGRSEEEARLLEIVRVLVDSWTFRPVGSAYRLGDWLRDESDGVSVAIPADYTDARLEEGWLRYSAEAPGSFVALRTENGGLEDLARRQLYWLEMVGAGNGEFSSNDAYEVELAGQRWIRSDYAYADPLGEVVWGTVAGKYVEDQLIFTWFEAPPIKFDALEREIFTIVAADAHPAN